MLLSIMIASAVVAFAMAYAIGANDVANAIGTAVGSGCLSLKSALVLGGIFEFVGGATLGYKVSDTLRENIIETDRFVGQEDLYIIGMFCALVGSSIWLLVATHYGLPVSTTHTIVSGILAFGACAEGFDAVMWDEIGFIAMSWVISPFLGAIVAYSIMYPLDKYILSDEEHAEAKTRNFIPFFFAGTVTVLLVFVLLETVDPSVMPIWLMFLIAFGSGAFTWIVIHKFLFQHIIFLASRIAGADDSDEDNDPLLGNEAGLPPSQEQYTSALRSASTKLGVISAQLAEPGAVVDPATLQDLRSVSHDLETKTKSYMAMSSSNVLRDCSPAERLFVVLQILTACFVAFSHGANDVANAMGPFAGILSVYRNNDVTQWDNFDWYVPVISSFAIVLGLATMGKAVISTIGEKVTKLTPSRGFVSLLAAALTVTAATLLSIPVSTTHTIVGAITGVGLVRGWRSVDLSVLANIAASWFLTIPAGFILTTITFLIMIGADDLWLHILSVDKP
eukprot:TRINITY_DN3516_c0_g1_i1.p1 TRINITY_DN3516_c0_g1~~TRINITY_DN3516_c0_g1_i1.p1  ORF type:complete len:507 (+),score=123.14 TRINITY_DN3516_c0_g1_i1:63-1583(+)